MNIDSKIKIINTSRGIKHVAAAALIINQGNILFVERRTHPFGLELPAGHVEHGETIEQAVRREVYEEVGLKISGEILLANIEHPESYCRYGSDVEEWAVFLIEYIEGQDYVGNSEIESVTWVPLPKIPTAQLTPPTAFVLEKLGYLPKEGG